ncbi:dTMP kinase [Candidatus Micrarchaeota archaeon]|nr:dTMP kinase [Candidatus Micrarchaeota archaeon]
MTGKLIVLEGLSAAGKHTQAKLLLESLQKSGKKASLYSFPDYDSEIGQLIAQYLSGKWGPKEDLVQTAVILYALDRYQNAPKIRNALQDNDVVILDRYSPANYAFQGALVPEGKEKQALWAWIDAVEKNLPQADAVIFLDVPRNLTQQNYAGRNAKNPLSSKGQEQDIHEADTAFENRVHQNYLELAKSRKWAVVDCVQNGKLLLAEKIHGRIQDVLAEKNIG